MKIEKFPIKKETENTINMDNMKQLLNPYDN